MAKIILIAAMNLRRVIGNNGKQPWSIPEDLQRFRQLTTGHTVLMGRKTFVAIGRPLPRRRNIVVSRQRDFFSEGITVYSDLPAALEAESSAIKIYIIGGGEIYRQTIGMADELVLTVVENNDDGDVFFPDFLNDPSHSFTLTDRELCTGFRYDTYKKSAP